MRLKSLLLVLDGSGINRWMFAKVAGCSGYIRLATRNRVQVLPDLGNETRKTSSGRMIRLRPGRWSPSPRLMQPIKYFVIFPYMPCSRKSSRPLSSVQFHPGMDQAGHSQFIAHLAHQPAPRRFNFSYAGLRQFRFPASRLGGADKGFV